MKKIDANKSLIFGINVKDLKKSMNYLCQEGYFSDSKDFSEYEEGNLVRVHGSYFMFRPFELTHSIVTISFFSYFIPKSEVVFVEEEPKEKTLRQFKSIDEFFAVTGFKIGDIVRIKNFAGCIFDEKTLIAGFRVYTNEECHRTDVIFDSSARPLDELFKHYKYFKNGEWVRFGVEE